MHNEKTLLTKREIEIVILASGELSTKQIAGKLNISSYTVETHMKSIRNKTGAFTIVGVLMYAVRNNIITILTLLFICSYVAKVANF